MNVMPNLLKSMSIFLAVIIILTGAPANSALAAMIDTEAILDATRGSEARAYLHQLLARKDVKDAFVAQGIDPNEAWARINSLSDKDVITLADHIDRLPAGAGAIEFLVVVILVGFIVLVILDLTGVTDVFPFIKSQR